ncbi:MAG: YbjN domain-containing protein [Ruminococcus sp.]|nr:YbjN domain-containing protein [Ruminococcus sp.]
MSDERKMKFAQSTYATVCKMFDAQGWHYDRHDDDLVIHATMRGDDLPIEFLVIVDADRQLVSFISPMPFEVNEDKRMDMAIAVTVANYGLADGSFDYNLADGSIRFRMTSSFRESILGAELFEYMVFVACKTVDVYNDKFLMLAKGMMDIEKFIEMEMSDNE